MVFQAKHNCVCSYKVEITLLSIVNFTSNPVLRLHKEGVKKVYQSSRISENQNFYLGANNGGTSRRCTFFLIGIHSMQGRTATTRHGVTRKKSTKRLKHTGNLFRKNLQLIGVC